MGTSEPLSIPSGFQRLALAREALGRRDESRWEDLGGRHGRPGRSAWWQQGRHDVQADRHKWYLKTGGSCVLPLWAAREVVTTVLVLEVCASDTGKRR